jgi:hypothetical protein
LLIDKVRAVPVDDSITAIHRSIAEWQSAREALGPGDDPGARLRAGLTAYFAFVDANAGGYMAVMHGRLSTHDEVRATVDLHRGATAERIIHGIGAPTPAPPAIRAAVNAWLGFVDQLLVDHITHHDLALDVLVDLAASTLLSALGSAAIAST